MFKRRLSTSIPISVAIIIAASLVGVLPARGADVPFTERVISTSANGAVSVFATDVDGDGDIDVLSASLADDKIAWYESDGGSPPTFTERVISTNANFANSVFATDLDGDGDTDVLSASANDDKIAWYESDGGSPPTFTERVISTTADDARSVFATDLDGDGDIDVLSASFFDDMVEWYENTSPSPSPPVGTPLPAPSPQDFRTNRHVAFNPNNATDAVKFKVEIADLVCSDDGDSCSYDADCNEHCQCRCGFRRQGRMYKRRGLCYQHL